MRWGGNKNQRWPIVDNGDGPYGIVSVRNGLPFGAAAASSGAMVQSVENGSANAAWTLSSFDVSIGEGCYSISTSLNGSQVLDVAGGSAANGANFQIYGSNGTLAQKWYVRTADNGSLTLQNVGSELYLAANAAGNVVQVEGSSSESAQWEPCVQMGGLSLMNREKVARPSIFRAPVPQTAQTCRRMRQMRHRPRHGVLRAANL